MIPDLTEARELAAGATGTDSADWHPAPPGHEAGGRPLGLWLRCGPRVVLVGSEPTGTTRVAVFDGTMGVANDNP